MKKKNFILFFLLMLFYTTLLKAQDNKEYISMLQENRVWSIQHEKHVLMGDTIINDQTYKKLYFHNYLEELTPDSLQYIAALREDSTNTKVYYIFHGQEEEHLLYDFSLEVGDEFHVHSPMFTLSSGPLILPENHQSPESMEVVEVKDSLIAGVVRKVLHFNNISEWVDGIEWWIEGIGSTMGIMYSGNLNYIIADGSYAFLLCYHQGEQLILQNDDPWGYPNPDNPCYSLPATNLDEIDDLEILITPTLFKDYLRISVSEPFESITIYHQSGRVVYNAQAFHNAPYNLNITTQDWQRGLFIVSFQGINKVANYKVIKY
ncbi:MAG: hypothetical protein ACLFQS_11985 [Bacteroidales bacterium]